MENVRRSKNVALELLEDTKDMFEGIKVESPINNPNSGKFKNSDVDVEAGPSTSRDKSKKPTEFVKYGKITFNTTAILHHYPQIAKNKGCTENCLPNQSVSVATKKSDLNLAVDEIRVDNNNDVKSENKQSKITGAATRDNYNNNETAKVDCVINSDNTVEILKKPVKFTEEKLV